MKKGIDLAKWNKVSDYNKVKQAGVDFAIVKVINASNQPDSRFREHLIGLGSAGIPVIGGYTYSYANTVEKARAAAQAFVENAKEAGLDTMWLDLEDAAVKNLGSRIVDIINTYRMYATSAGMGFGIYTGAQYYNPYLKPYADKLADIPIWWARYPYIRDYTVDMDIPDMSFLPQNMPISGWQYSSKCVIDGIKGYVDLNAWYDDTPFENVSKIITAIPFESNPFTEPVSNVKVGKTGNDANWVQWYLWRFGKLTDGTGQADATKINGIFDDETEKQVKEVQALLGLTADGIVGKITRALWKKIC